MIRTTVGRYKLLIGVFDFSGTGLDILGSVQKLVFDVQIPRNWFKLGTILNNFETPQSERYRFSFIH